MLKNEREREEHWLVADWPTDADRHRRLCKKRRERIEGRERILLYSRRDSTPYSALTAVLFPSLSFDLDEPRLTVVVVIVALPSAFLEYSP